MINLKRKDMKDDKCECQDVCKQIEKHFKSKNYPDILYYTDYCLMWEKSMRKFPRKGLSSKDIVNRLQKLYDDNVFVAHEEYLILELIKFFGGKKATQW